MSTVEPEYTEAERMLNLGIPIETKNMGELRVKELSLESIISLGGDLVDVFQEISGPESEDVAGDSRGLSWMKSALSNPKTMKVLKKVAAASTGKNHEDFSDLGVKDWLNWANAFKEVTDWEEVSQLFFNLIPRESLSGRVQGDEG
jgi:hypothetical protein